MRPLPDIRAEQLFEEGALALAALWDEDAAMVRLAEHPEYHDPRGTLAYAQALLRGGDAARAERAIAAVLAMQETREQDAHFGNFRWLLEEACVTDLNGVEFMLDGLIALLHEHAATLSVSLAGAMRGSIALGLAEIDRLDVHSSYTNIALSDIANSVLGGELLGDARYVERGERRLDGWLAFTTASGAPHEFNSATYTAVDIARLAAIVEDTQDPRIALKARIAEERLWLHVAAHYHPGLAQLGGAHSRSYFDGWSGAGGYLKLLLWRVLGDAALRRETLYAPRSREEGHIGIALGAFHCPRYAERLLIAKQYPFEARETPDAAHGLDITSHLTESYALGTASRTYAVGEPPEQWPGFDSLHLYVKRDRAPGYGALYVRYVIDDKAPGQPGDAHGAADHWDEGRHVAVQDRNRAIVAYGLMPRIRPAHSCKLSIRLLGFSSDDELWVADRRIDAWLAPVAAGEPVVMTFGDAYLALIPLPQTDMGSAAPIALNRNEDTLTLDIYNYKGPPKSFWEHRSQGGPFFRGNVRNAFAIEVAERSAYPDMASFRRHIGAARLTDTTDAERRRRIEYASESGSVALTYSLRDMSLVERHHDGAVYAPPPARFGASGGGGQFLQTAAASVDLGRSRLVSTPATKWLFADDDAREYVVTNPLSDDIQFCLWTPDAEIACDAFGFGRIALDEVARTVRVDVIGEPPAVKIVRGVGLSVIVNGVEVSGGR